MEGISRAESDFRDADLGVEMSEFVRAQMLTQTGVAMMSQANLSPTMVASLVGHVSGLFRYRSSRLAIQLKKQIREFFECGKVSNCFG